MEKDPKGSITFTQAISEPGVYWLMGKRTELDSTLIKIEVIETLNTKKSRVKVYWDNGSTIQLVYLEDINWDNIYFAFDNYWFAYAAKKQMEKNHGHPVQA